MRIDRIMCVNCQTSCTVLRRYNSLDDKSIRRNDAVNFDK